MASLPTMHRFEKPERLREWIWICRRCRGFDAPEIHGEPKFRELKPDDRLCQADR